MKKRIPAAVFGILFLLLSVCPVLADGLPRSETPDYKVAFYAFDCYHMQDENGLRSARRSLHFPAIRRSPHLRA